MTEEDTRVTGQDNRVTEEDNRVSGEDTRVTGEDIRVTGQDNRVTGQDNRVTGQDIRVTGQDNRVTEEDNRVTGEVCCNVLSAWLLMPIVFLFSFLSKKTPRRGVTVSRRLFTYELKLGYKYMNPSGAFVFWV